MKYCKTFVLIVGIALFSVTNLYGQETNAIERKNFKKTSVDQIPEKVKTAALRYKGYKIKEIFVGAEKSTAKLYKVTLFKDKSSFTILVDKKGRLVKTLE